MCEHGGEKRVDLSPTNSDLERVGAGDRRSRICAHIHWFAVTRDLRAAIQYRYQGGVLRVARRNAVAPVVLNGDNPARRRHAERLGIAQIPQAQIHIALRKSRLQRLCIKVVNIEFGRAVHRQAAAGDFDRSGPFSPSNAPTSAARP